MQRSPDQALLSLRSAVILGASCIIGALAAFLTYAGSGSLAEAALATGAGTGSAIGLLNQIIGPPDEDG